MVYLFIVVPYVDNVNMTVYIVNELACYICCLNMILFTDYVETAESRWKFGYVFMAAIITIGVINFSIAIVLEARNLYRDLKYKYIPDFKKKIGDFKRKRKEAKKISSRKQASIDKKNFKKQVIISGLHKEVAAEIKDSSKLDLNVFRNFRRIQKVAEKI